MVGYLLVGLLWMLAFFSYTSDFVVVVSATTYYFDSDKYREGTASVFKGIRLAHLNHAGSIAFGALTIGLVCILKLTIYYPCK